MSRSDLMFALSLVLFAIALIAGEVIRAVTR